MANARDPEWVKYAALLYVKVWASYRLRRQMKEGRIAELMATMENLGAVRYDREGGSAPYSDRRPEIMDTIEQLIDDLEGDLEREEMDYQAAVAMFADDPDATIVWLKYGEGMTWDAVGARVGYTGRNCRNRAPKGFRYVFDHMPHEYRRVPVNAEEWMR